MRLCGSHFHDSRRPERKWPAHGCAHTRPAIGIHILVNHRFRPGLALYWDTQTGRCNGSYAPSQPDALPHLVPVVAADMVHQLRRSRLHSSFDPMLTHKHALGPFSSRQVL